MSRVKELFEDLESAEDFKLALLGGEPELVEAWEVLIDQPSLRIKPGNLIIINSYLIANSNISINSLKLEIPHNENLVKVWLDRLNGIKTSINFSNPTLMGSPGGSLIFDMVDGSGNFIGQLKRVPGGGGNNFSYFYTDHIGGNGLIKNHQYSLNSQVSPAFIVATSMDAPDLQIPVGEKILYGDLQVPILVNTNVSGLGKSMFEDAFKYFDNFFNLDGLYGAWKSDPDLYADYGGESINLTKFKQALASGSSPHQAAFATITGQWAQLKGLNDVEFIDFDISNLNEVNVIFR